MVRGCAVSGEPPMLHNRMKEVQARGHDWLFFREIVWIVNDGHLDFQMHRGGERIAARNAKRSISMILRKNRGL